MSNLRPMDALPFLPVLREWFQDHFESPTPPQAEAWPLIKQGRDVLVAAPTGSGKTLAAFLSAIDDLVRLALEGELEDQTHVLYVSPLQALSRDIEFNLQKPLFQISERFEQAGVPPFRLRTGVRTGDTPPKDRAAQLKKPPHLLVTTPESLYLLLTTERGRDTLSTVKTVIVDEIHATIGSKRGAHLALSLERLDDLVRKRLAGQEGTPGRDARPTQRIGLSATQNPIDEVARFLVGFEEGKPRPCAIVDHGHARQLELSICLPKSPLEAVMSAEAQTEVYDQLAQLIESHQSTLIFTNTRKLAERITRFVGERIGSHHVTSHHGSLSKALRQSAERRLREGQLRALVATASLELGIDVGDIDLVCQIGSPGSVSSLLQRVGRSGHARTKTPKGRLFPQTRDDLIECIALLDCVERGELDRIEVCQAPLDILAQQIIARLADSSCDASDLFATFTRAAPFANLAREKFDQVISMVSEGFVTSRGRRGAFVHLDETTGRLRGRRGARLAALTSGGAIPDSFDYEVLLSPTDVRIGSLNEDFAIESSAGDIFQLGNVSYQIEKIEPGVVRVRDATGAPPNLPFWLGEAPSRSDLLSSSVSRFRSAVAEALKTCADDPETASRSLGHERNLPQEIVLPAVEYLGQSQRALGQLPTQRDLVAERFFDETGCMHVVIHSSFGMRINRAYALTLRKRFCRSFNVELQAAAGEDAILLSLGPTHSFPLESLWDYVRSSSAEAVLTQALLDSPLFQTRFRWNATRSLAVLRRRGGKKKPPRFQRLEADDLLALCFPDQVACLENIPGDREIPDHPLVAQTIDDSLTEAMDLRGLLALLRQKEAGAIRFHSVDVSEPSLIAHEILTAKPYTFLDDAPLEERRAQAVFLRRQGLPQTTGDLGRLDPQAISRVQAEAEPDPRDPEELHDALSIYLFATTSEIRRWESRAGVPLLPPLISAGRAVLFEGQGLVTVPKFQSSLRAGLEGETESLAELCRGRLEWSGPVTVSELCHVLPLERADLRAALCRLEAEGFVLRGHFRSGSGEEEFCERRLLARIHRRTIGELRKQIAPVSSAQFLEFLCRHQGATGQERRRGPEGTLAAIEQLSGFPVPAGSWENDILRLRVADYSPAFLDQLSLMGRVSWRAAREGGNRLTRATPVVLLARADGLASAPQQTLPAEDLGADARKLAETLAQRGASFFPELVQASGLLPSRAEAALSELVARGICTTDGLSGLRTLIASEAELRRASQRGGRPGRSYRAALPGSLARLGLEWAGRISWAPPLPGLRTSDEDQADLLLSAESSEQHLEALAWRLLRRWGIVFRRLLLREAHLPPWRDLLRVYFRWEARGEIRGGRFVSGFSGEQFALPSAVASLRAVRSASAPWEEIVVSPADPLNLQGILTGEPLISRASKKPLLIRGGEFFPLSERRKAETPVANERPSPTLGFGQPPA